MLGALFFIRGDLLFPKPDRASPTPNHQKRLSYPKSEKARYGPSQEPKARSLLKTQRLTNNISQTLIDICYNSLNK
ncbi:MAG TPA: hypothetical protein DCS91_13915 [Microcoleaceae bacterium UBA11344]|nr:hypothetical protein [Microcoleaceae cyanobacterium UBA11344]